MSEIRKPSVADSVAQALAPLTELFLNARLGVGDMVAVVKVAFVHAAIARAKRSGGEVPDFTRIGVETGLDRDQVAAILKQRRSKPLPFRRGRARAERVLSGWWTDEDFCDDKGKPAILRLRGPVPSFVKLAQRYGGAGRAQPVLNELLQTGAVKKREDGRYQALRQTLLNVAWDKDSVVELGLQLRQLGEALLHNLNHPDAPQLAQYFQSEPLDVGHAVVLLRDLKADGELFLQSAMDRLNTPLYAALKGSEEASRRVAIGVQVIDLPKQRARAARRGRTARGGRRRASRPTPSSSDPNEA